jgi:acylphosphatase
MERVRRVRLVATGEVQGVFFRDSTREEARRVGVTGWVRNRRDGAVEAEFQGPPDAVEQMVTFCRHGPGRADVSRVQAQEVDAVGQETGFEVR